METIKLKDKKKIFTWKRIFILFIAIGIIISINVIDIRYKYYNITPDYKITYIGVSEDKNLIDKSAMQYIKEIKEQGYLIADYNLTIAPVIELSLVKRWRKDDKEKIIEELKDNFTILVYCTQIQYQDKKFYIQNSEVNYFILKLKLLDSSIEIDKKYVYEDVRQVWNKQKIEEYFN